MKFDTVEDIRSWPLVDGWSVEPVTGKRVNLGYEVEIGDGVKLGDFVKLGYGVEIGYEVELGNNVTLGNFVELGYYVKLGNKVKLGNRVKLGDNVKLGNDVKLDSGEKWDSTPLQIQGTHHLLYEYTGGIGIGCHRYSIDYWLENFEGIGKNNHYSEDQITEYKGYLDIFNALGKGEKK